MVSADNRYGAGLLEQSGTASVRPAVLQLLQSGADGLGIFSACGYEKEDSSLPPVPFAGRNLDGAVMKEGIRGSYTVEASFVMAITLWVIVSCIQYAYLLHDQTAGAMVLQELMEIARHDEEGRTMDELAANGKRLAGNPFSLPEYDFRMNQTVMSVHGSVRAGVWEMEIRMKKFNPEEFLRMTTLFETRNYAGDQESGKELTGAEG